MKKHYTYLLLATAILFTKPITTTAQVDVNDSLALVDLYNSTDGPHWKNSTNWLTKKPIAAWYHVTATNNRVTQISLPSNKLIGTLPASLKKLTSLITLDFSNNQLSGRILSNIGMLSKLYSLNLSYNQLRSEIPSAIGDLKNLHDLNLSNNHLTGKIPSTLGNLTNLLFLHLNRNYLSGRVPASLGNLSYLYRLYLQNNAFTGTIPSSLGKIIPLRTLNLSHNQLSGSIPSSIIGSYISTLLLSDNYLTDTIPSNFKHSFFQVINFSNNKLSGSIPYQLGVRASNLAQLNLSNNNLTGSVPASLGYIYYLSDINLSHNKLSGKIPAELGNMYRLQMLNLSYNMLTGAIPSNLGRVETLRFLLLAHNRLNGAIPSTFSNLKNVAALYLNDNNLKDTVPVFFANLPYMKVLNIANNHFTFDGLEAIVQHKFDTLIYAPQKELNLNQVNNTLSIYAGGTLSNNTYKWYKDGALVSTINGDSTFTPTAGGAYNVEVTNSIVTELTLFSDTITFATLKAVQQNNIATQTLNANKFAVYPNPAKNMATIAFTATGNYTMKVTDINGKVLQTKTGVALKSTNTLQLNVSKYATGIYFVTITNNQKQMQTLKLNKE